MPTKMMVPKRSAALAALVLLAAGCADDSPKGNDSDSDSGPSTVDGPGTADTTEGTTYLCEPGAKQCNGQGFIQTCAPTGLEWLQEPCGLNEMCDTCLEDESCAEDRCVGLCELEAELPSSAGCSFIANRQLHLDEESPDGLIVTNPNEDLQVTVQLYRTPEGKRKEEVVGNPRVLQPGGHFFVVHSAFDVPDAHPLAHVLGHDSVLGRKQRIGFTREVQALHDRVQLLFKALDTPDVDRYDPTRRSAAAGRLASAGVALFRQQRPLGLGFARGLLSDRHLTDAGLQSAAFWAEAESRCAAAGPAQLTGTHDWALLHFARRPGRAAAVKVRACAVQAIGCSAPAD